MVWVQEKDRITVAELAEFFNEIDQELIGHLTIQKADGNLIDIKKQFVAHYHGRKCRYLKTEREIANTKFHTLFWDNIFKIKKIIKFQEHLLSEFDNLDLQRDETIVEHNSEYENESKSTGTNNSTNTNDRDMVDGILVGSSDASNLSTIRDKTNRMIEAKKLMEKSKDKALDWLDPNTKEVTQTITMYKGTDTFKTETDTEDQTGGKGSTKGGSKTFSSNPYKDRIEYINLKLPALIREFLNSFQILFHC